MVRLETSAMGNRVMVTNPCAQDTAKSVVERVQEGEQPANKLGCFDNLIEAFGIKQRALEEFHDNIKVPFGVVTGQ
jgi:hypothetical protein